MDANDKLLISNDPKAGIAYRLESKSVDQETGELLTTFDGTLRLYPPVTGDHNSKSVLGDNNTAIYHGISYDIAVNAILGGFSSYLVIHSASAPTSYEFEFGLPTGFKLSENGRGGVEMLNAANEVVGIIASSWAVDANVKQ